MPILAHALYKVRARVNRNRWQSFVSYTHQTTFSCWLIQAIAFALVIHYIKYIYSFPFHAENNAYKDAHAVSILLTSRNDRESNNTKKKLSQVHTHTDDSVTRFFLKYGGCLMVFVAEFVTASWRTLKKWLNYWVR